MTEKIETIRQACVKANPEIGEIKVFECGRCGDDNQQFYRPIRLADVLLAMFERDTVDEQTIAHKMLTNFSTRWNLSADDLTQQSPECIDFLYQLLQ